MSLTKIKNIYKALILSVKKKKIVVDARLKCLYNISINEFNSEDIPKLIGQEIDVYINNIDPTINKKRIASYKIANQEIAWSEVIKLYQSKKIVEGRINSATKGGYSVQLTTGFYAFLPLSQICEEESEKYRAESNEVLKFVILGINRLHFNIIVSRKEVVMQDVANMNQESLNTINVGASLFGIIKGIASNCLFVYINQDYSGIVLIEEIGHGNNLDIFKMFHIGQRIEAIATDIQENKIFLSIKKNTQNPMLGFIKNQKVDVLINRYIVSENNSYEITMFGTLVENPNIFCKVIKEDKLLDASQIDKIIEEKKIITVSIKLINEETYSLTCTTKKSNKEIWNQFKLALQENNDVVNGVLIGKNKNVLYFRFMEKEIYVPIINLSFYNSKQKYEDIKIGDTRDIHVTCFDKKQEAFGNIRKIEFINNEKIRNDISSLIKDNIVDVSLSYIVENNYAVLKLNHDIEQSIPCNKISNIINTLKNNTNITLKLQIISHDEYGNFELGPVNESSVKNTVKTKKFNIAEVISQFKQDQWEK